MLKSRAPKEPIKVNFTAINPKPFSKYLCPGKTPNADADSGAPKKIEGIKSRNVWVTAIATMNTHNTNGFVNCNKNGEAESSSTAIKFMCIPGINPVKIPANIPKETAIKICKNTVSHLS
jgi:hypothetical protein